MVIQEFLVVDVLIEFYVRVSDYVAIRPHDLTRYYLWLGITFSENISLLPVTKVSLLLTENMR